MTDYDLKKSSVMISRSVDNDTRATVSEYDGIRAQLFIAGEMVNK